MSTVVGQADDPAVAQGARRRVLDRRAARLADDVEHPVERLAHGVGARPAGERLGDRVQVLDPAGDVGGDDAIADARERGPQPLALRRDRRLGAVARGEVAREQEREAEQGEHRRDRRQRRRDQRRSIGPVGGGLAREQLAGLVARHLGDRRAHRIHVGLAGAEGDHVARQVEPLAVAQLDREGELAELGADPASHLDQQRDHDRSPATRRPSASSCGPIDSTAVR
jgi:hypothetical protein